MVETSNIVLAISIVAIVLSLKCLNDSKAKVTPKTKEYFMDVFPWNYTNPYDVNPYSVQSVYGQPGDYFQLATKGSNAGIGAQNTLVMVENAQRYLADHPVDWKLNQGFNAGGNAAWALEMGHSQLNAWKNL